MARMALTGLGLSGGPVRDPVRVREPASPASCCLWVNIGEDMDPRRPAGMAAGPAGDLYAAAHRVR
jgi:hypothetical protein